MKKLVGTLLLLCAGAGLAFAQMQTAPADRSSVAQALTQTEHDWFVAMVANDQVKLDQIVADDWAGLGPDGTTTTKNAYLAEIQSGTLKINSFQMGPLDVKVVGDVAVVQGSDTESSFYQGKDSSGKWIWTDVFARRNGKWVAVRSQISKAS